MIMKKCETCNVDNHQRHDFLSHFREAFAYEINELKEGRPPITTSATQLRVFREKSK